MSMDHVSPHGLAFAFLQFVIVFVLVWALHAWHSRGARSSRSCSRRQVHGVPILVMLGFVVWFVVLRTRPVARGSDPFSYSLGVFDGVSAVGLGVLLLLQFLWARRMRANPVGEEDDRFAGGGVD